MPLPPDAVDLGRRFDRIERARGVLAAWHFGFGLAAISAVLVSTHTAIFDVWLASASVHLEPTFRATTSRRATEFFVVLLTAVPYVLSWLRISDSILEAVTGVRFWSGVGAYLLLFGAASIASDVALIVAAAPPASALWFVVTLFATGGALGSVAGAAELVATGQLPSDDGI